MPSGTPGSWRSSTGSWRGSADSPATASTGTGTPLLLADVRHLLAHRLGGRPTRANFRTGTLTVCTMVPMRSVPHRVVCLLGLDDGVFPRSGSVDGDDVLARNPMTGERDVRSEDRQLFLDAILAASETLVITYTGANEHTGADRPPAVPLGELLDALDADGRRRPVREHGAASAPAAAVRRAQPRGRRARRHPAVQLRPRRARRGRRPAGPRVAATTLLPEPLPARPQQDVALADLQAFLAHPVRAFLRSRLDVTAPLEAEETLDAIPVTLDGLEKWEVGDRLLRRGARRQDPADVVRAEQLRGNLPPGPLGGHALQEIEDHLKRPRSRRPRRCARATRAPSTWTSTSAAAAG